MAKVSQKYETIFIIRTSVDEESRKALIERFKGIIEENGTINEVDEWGNRRLAYPIDDERDGYYVLINFTSEPGVPAELDRVYQITEDILRSIIVTKE